MLSDLRLTHNDEDDVGRYRKLDSPTRSSSGSSDDDNAGHSPGEQQPQPQSGDVIPLNSPVTVESQPQAGSHNVASLNSADSQAQPQSDNIASLNSPGISTTIKQCCFT